MASTINTNIVSINGQRNLALSGSSLATSMQRLSSGLRVNSAKDDAAGLAISERMNSQVRGLTVASRNANDGISLAQTAEGALGKVGDMLQRMRELAVQAGNATNSASDRKALQAEVQQLSAEIDRVAKTTNFNGQKLLEGSFAGAVFQVGANSGDNITLGSLADTRSHQLASVSYASYDRTIDTSDTPTPSIARFNEPLDAGTLSVQINSTPPLTVPLERIEAATSSQQRLGQVAQAINNKSADTGVTAYLTKQTDDSYHLEIMSSKVDGQNQPYTMDFLGFQKTTTGIVLPPTHIDVDAIFGVAPDDLETLARNVDFPTVPGGVYDGTIPADPIAIQKFEEKISKILENPIISTILNDKNGYWTTAFSSTGWETWDATMKRYEFVKNQGTLGMWWQFQADDLASSLYSTATIYNRMSTYRAALEKNPEDNVAKNDYIWALSNYTAPSYYNAAPFDEADKYFPWGWVSSHTHQTGIDNIDISTQSGVWIALQKIDSAINQVNSARATLGAMQSRFENAVNNIDIQAENLSAARGRIVDADFAKETANLSRTQILQQAGSSMVAQANQIPQQVLQLLKS